MNSIVEFLKTVWGEIGSVVELFIYLGIAYAISKIFGVRFLHAVSIVFVYFLMNLLRVIVEIHSRR